MRIGIIGAGRIGGNAGRLSPARATKSSSASPETMRSSRLWQHRRATVPELVLQPRRPGSVMW